MRRALTALLSVLPFDSKSCRAIEETVLDWAHEETAPQTRRFASFRGLMAVARATARCTAWELARVPVLTILTPAFAIVVVPTVLLATLGWGHAGTRGPSVTTGVSVALALAAALQILFVLSPVAMFLVVSRGVRSKVVPALGTAALTMTALLVAGSSVVPMANREFHAIDATTRVKEGSKRPVHPMPPPPGDVGPAALVAAVADRPLGAAGGVLLFRTGVAAVGAILVLLASIISQLEPSRRRGWIAGVAVVYTVCFAWFPSSWEFGGHAHALVGLMPWLLAGAALLAAITLGRRLVSDLASRAIV